jgi:glycosyltransferase involved in cell wall biosynthesis
MTILLLYPDFGAFGGIERYLLQLVQGLTNKPNSQYQFVLACTHGQTLQAKAKAIGINTHGIKVFQPLQALFAKPAFRVFDLWSVWQLWQLCQQVKPTVVHVHIGQWENLWLRLWGYPVVYTFHGYGALYDWPSTPAGLKRMLKKALTGLFKTTAMATSTMVFVSQAEKDRMKTQGYLPKEADFNESRYPIIYNGINVGQWQQRALQTDVSTLKTSVGLPENATVVSYVDRLDDNKNPLLFLDAIDCLFAQYPQPDLLYVLLVGDGPLAQAVSHRITSSPNASHIKPLGLRDDVAELLTLSNLILHPATREGFGLGVLEAMAVGTPCLAWPVGGIAELLNTPALQALHIKDLTADTIAQQALSLLLLPDNVRKTLKLALQTQATCFDEAVFLTKMDAVYRKFQPHA